MPYVSVTVPTTSGSTTNIGLNTDITFPTGVGTSVPKTCQTILQRARQENKAQFQDIYKLERLKTQFAQTRDLLSNPTLSQNADVTTQEFVAETLISIFNYSSIEAEEMTMKIHHEGSAVVATLSYELAEQKGIEVTVLARNHGFPLAVKIEQE